MATKSYTMEEIIRNVILRYGLNELLTDDPSDAVYTNLDGELISNQVGVIRPELESKIRKLHRYTDKKIQIYLIFYKECLVTYDNGIQKTFYFSTCITSNDISFKAIIQGEGQKVTRVFSWDELKEVRDNDFIRESDFHSIVGDPVFMLVGQTDGYSFHNRNNYTNIPAIYFARFSGLTEPLNDIINKKYVSFSNSWGSKRSEKPYGRRNWSTDGHRVKAIRKSIEASEFNKYVFDNPNKFLYTNLDGTLKNGRGKVIRKYEEADIRASHYFNNGETIYAIFSYSVSGKLEKGDTYKVDFSTCITSDMISIRGIDTSNEEETSFCSYYTLAWDDLREVRHLDNVTREHPNLLEADPFFTLLPEANALAFYTKTGEEIVVPMVYFSVIPLEDFFNDVLNPQRIEDRKKLSQYYDAIETYKAQKDYQKLLETVEQVYNDRLSIPMSDSDYYIIKTIALAGLQRKEEAIREFERFREYMEEADEDDQKTSLGAFLKTRALIYALDKKYYLAAQDSETVVAIEKEKQRPEIVEEYREKQKENYQQFLTHFKEQPLKDRNIVTIAKTNQLFKSDHLTLLNIDNLPTVNFPMSHPKINHTYIAHPYRTDSYLPIENYDYELLNDRLNEFFYFLQCLGATSISYEVVEDESSESANRNYYKNNQASSNDNRSGQSNSNNNSVNVGTGIPIAEVKIETNWGKTNSSEDHQNNRYATDEEQENIMNSSLRNFLKMGRTQTFNPIRKPYIPDNLIWYPNEFTWQRIAQQRLSGNMLSHSEMLSSSQSQTLSSSEILTINEELDNLFETVSNNSSHFDINVDLRVKIVKGSVGYSNDQSSSNNSSQSQSRKSSSNYRSESKAKKNRDYALHINVEFKPMNEFPEEPVAIEVAPQQALQSVVQEATDDEACYLEEVRFMLEDDGQIDERERAILERFRTRYNITPERAQELEAQAIASAQLTPAEQEYLEEYKNSLQNGVISERERRLLSRLATALGIDEARVAELEASLK